MGTVVVGIFADNDAVEKLTDAMKTQGLDLERLRIISNETPSDDLISSGVQFFAGDAEPETLATGEGIITGMGGMGVPGLTTYSSPRYDVGSHAPSTDELLSELNIPQRRVPDFEKALESGRSIVGYNAGNDVDRVKSLFSSAGATPVEVF